MAKYWIDTRLVYTDKNGQFRCVDRYTLPLDSHIFDTSDPFWGVPNGFVPPVVGVRPLDAAAKTALDAARAPFVGKQLPGIGMVPANEPIYNP